MLLADKRLHSTLLEERIFGEFFLSAEGGPLALSHSLSEPIFYVDAAAALLGGPRVLAGRLGLLGHAEVDEAHVAALVEQQIGRLEVAEEHEP